MASIWTGLFILILWNLFKKPHQTTTMPPTSPFFCHLCFVVTWFSITEWWHSCLKWFLWWIPRQSLGGKHYFSFASPTPNVPYVYLKRFSLVFSFWGEISQWLRGIYPSSYLSGLPKPELAPHSVRSNHDLPQTLKPYLNLDFSPHLGFPLEKKNQGNHMQRVEQRTEIPEPSSFNCSCCPDDPPRAREEEDLAQGREWLLDPLGKGSLGLSCEIWKCVEIPAVTRKMQISMPDK